MLVSKNNVEDENPNDDKVTFDGGENPEELDIAKITWYYPKNRSSYWPLNFVILRKDVSNRPEAIKPETYDIDFMNAHPHFNYLNYNFDCATIDPRARFKKIERSLGIKIHDPAPALRHSFEMRIREGNFIPYFFTADDNHFTSVAAGYVAEVIANEW